MQLNRLLLAGTLVIAACGDDDPADMPVSILATAQATPSLSTLVVAIEFASDNNDLVNLLAASGSLTVFAPTNAAFDALAVELTGQADAVGADLLTAANRPLLRSALQFHVLGTRVTSGEIPFGRPIETAEGGVLKIEAGAELVITDGRNRASQIIVADLIATNGVIHVIDRVLLPADMNIVETARALASSPTPEFTLLAEAIGVAQLTGTLSSAGPFTVFAPTDAAFVALLAELGTNKLALFANPRLLVEVLSYHVVRGRVFEVEIPFGVPIVTVQGAPFTVDNDLDILDARAREANILRTDVIASNGVVHIIDRVLLPPP